MTGPDDQPALDFDLADSVQPPRQPSPDDAALKPEDMHNLRINYGKYQGERWTRLPLSYLKHMSNNAYGPVQRLATLELQRRGYVWTPDIELTGHAIDRASLNLRMNWMASRTSDQEGLHTWLVRTAGQAYASIGAPELRETQEPYDVDAYYQGMKLVFTVGHLVPILKTIMPKEDQRRGNIRIKKH